MKRSYHVFQLPSLSIFQNRTPGIGLWILTLLLTACAYRMGSPERSLPNSYRQVTIPIFKNLSMEPAVEVTFTNSLVKEFERSKVGRIVEPSQAEAVIEGVISSITYRAGSPSTQGLPTGAVMTSTYDIIVVVSIVVKRLSDQAVLWSGEFSRSRSYSAPQVLLPGVNTVNPLYNLSARRQNFNILAADMMAEAHDRLTEHF